MRDRASYTQSCVTALLRADLHVVIVDHGSTYPGAVRWLKWAAHYTDVERLGNQHPRDLWAPGNVLDRHLGAQPEQRFIVTDCDVVPDRNCPADWVRQLGGILDRLPSARKAGLGLRTDDLHPRNPRRDEIRAWEAQYQAVADGGHLDILPGESAVRADIDTTLAMYRRFEPFALGPAVRTRLPYLARHLAWYENPDRLTPELAYYYEHAEHGHWRAPEGYADNHGLESGS